MDHSAAARRERNSGLLQRFRRRDPEALGAVFDRFGPNVYAFFSRIEPDADRLDQRVEEVFWEVWVLALRAGDDGEMRQLVRQALAACLSRTRGTPRTLGDRVSDEKTVLLVEDDADNQMIYSVILKHHGYAVLQAMDGELGVQMARDHCPDLILMDLTMPRIDGLQATRMLKADPVTTRIPVIALTAHGQPEDRQAAHDAGCVSFLAKPVEPRRVAAEVGRVLGIPTGTP